MAVAACTKDDEYMKFDIREIFVNACKNNEIKKVIFICDSLNLNVSTKSQSGRRSGLVDAAVNKSEEVVAWLLAQPGLQVNMVVDDADDPPSTALTAACRAGHPDIVRRLVRAPDVDLNWQDRYGLTAAHWAARRRAACVEVLAGVPGVDWNRKNGGGQTPLFWALANGNSSSVRNILAIPGVDYTVTDNDGDTLAHATVYGESVECVELLAGAEEVPWNQKDQDGDTPLMLALKWRRLDIAKVMLQCPRVDVTVADDNGQTPEMWAR